ncbi:SapB/AmfS family lanthipeptide [Streptomyces sp. RK9]
MAIYDLQGLGAETSTEMGELGNSNASSVTCCVPSPNHSSWSITCRDC